MSKRPDRAADPTAWALHTLQRYQRLRQNLAIQCVLILLATIAIVSAFAIPPLHFLVPIPTFTAMFTLCIIIRGFRNGIDNEELESARQRIKDIRKLSPTSPPLDM